jgi:hypothetical protein
LDVAEARLPSWWRTPLQWRRLSGPQRRAVAEERFIRMRSRNDLLRHRRPGEFSIPGVKFTLTVAVLLGVGLRLVGVGSLAMNVLVVGLVVLLATVLLLVLLGLFVRVDGGPHEPPFGNAGDRVPR